MSCFIVLPAERAEPGCSKGGETRGVLEFISL